MALLQTLLIVYLCFAVPLLIGAALAWLPLRRQIALRTADWLLLVLPVGLWLVAPLLLGANRSLTHLGEAIALGGIAALLFALRTGLSIPHPQRQAALATGALAASCAVALALPAFVPLLPG